MATGYTRVSGDTLYSGGGGYGWDDPQFAGNDRDRGAPDDLRRDMNQHSIDKIFSIDLSNDVYRVGIIMGDNSYAHDDMDVYAEGALVLGGISNGIGEFKENAFYITVLDGKLDITMHDDGGGDPNWVINALTIERVLHGVVQGYAIIG